MSEMDTTRKKLGFMGIQIVSTCDCGIVGKYKTDNTYIAIDSHGEIVANNLAKMEYLNGGSLVIIKDGRWRVLYSLRRCKEILKSQNISVSKCEGDVPETPVIVSDERRVYVIDKRDQVTTSWLSFGGGARGLIYEAYPLVNKVYDGSRIFIDNRIRLGALKRDGKTLLCENLMMSYNKFIELVENGKYENVIESACVDGKANLACLVPFKGSTKGYLLDTEIGDNVSVNYMDFIVLYTYDSNRDTIKMKFPALGHYGSTMFWNGGIKGMDTPYSIRSVEFCGVEMALITVGIKSRAFKVADNDRKHLNADMMDYGLAVIKCSTVPNKMGKSRDVWILWDINQDKVAQLECGLRSIYDEEGIDEYEAYVSELAVSEDPRKYLSDYNRLYNEELARFGGRPHGCIESLHCDIEPEKDIELNINAVPDVIKCKLVLKTKYFGYKTEYVWRFTDYKDNDLDIWREYN